MIGNLRLSTHNRLARYKVGKGPSQRKRFGLALQESHNDFTITKNGKNDRSVTTSVCHNPFAVSKDYALARCVSQDLRVLKLIASVFRKKSRSIKELESRHPAVGAVYT